MQGCPKDTVERVYRRRYLERFGSISSSDRKFPSTERRRSIPARAAQVASSSSAGGEPWFPGAAAVRLLRPECSRPHEFLPRDSLLANAATPAVQFAVPSSRRARPAARNASAAAHRPQPGGLARAQRSACLLQSSLESWVQALAIG